MRRLLEIHWMALHPVKVLSIVGGIALSFVAIELAGRAAGLALGGGHPLARHVAIFEALFQARRFDWIALIAVWMCGVWATLGGAATRRISLDILGVSGERFVDSLRYCFKWSLLFPSALAVCCFGFVLLARLHPWLLVLLLPVWLYAGLYYGALTLEEVGLRDAARRVHAGLRRTGGALALQLRFLVSFAVSTAAVHLAAIVVSVAVRRAVGGRGPGELLAAPSAAEILLIAPVLVYAAGYTTSNLKSLQVLLYTRIVLEPCSLPTFARTASSWRRSPPTSRAGSAHRA